MLCSMIEEVTGSSLLAVRVDATTTTNDEKSKITYICILPRQAFPAIKSQRLPADEQFISQPIDTPLYIKRTPKPGTYPL